MNMTVIFFACDSLSQQVELGSAGWFCSHPGPLILLKSSGNSPGASGQKMVSLTCLIVMPAVGWAFISSRASSGLLMWQQQCFKTADIEATCPSRPKLGSRTASL